MAFFPVEYVTRSPDASPGVHANGIDRAADRVTARRACAAAGVMLAAHYVVAFVLFLSLPFIYVDASSRFVDGVISLRHVNATHVALVTFNAVNALICVWEIALWCHRERVKKLSRGYIKKFGDRVRRRRVEGRTEGESARARGFVRWPWGERRFEYSIE